MHNTLVLTFTIVLAGSVQLISDEPNFNRDIRPILSDRCYFCHGPDSENRQSGLRLDTQEGAKDVIESGYFLERVFAEDPEERMPPPTAKIELSEEEKELLAKWVASGAKYERHWAFQPLPTTVNVPEVSDNGWSKQGLDRFVWDSLKKLGEKPSPEAAPPRWLRRVTLDLTGLPPTLEEMDRFKEALAQEPDREKVYRDVVKRLLSSPAYGEHMAVAWLDAARYADSYGYQSDRLNTQWPYRDWVVKAFNENLPYDDFLTWQLAGDLLEAPTQDQRLATAFNRIHRLNNEGGAVFEEWRLENVADRVQTFGTAMLGLTLECCRCHDHKYDPIPMRDYYSMSAFFNSIDENGVYDVPQKVPVPSLLLPNDSQAANLEQCRDELKRAESEYQSAVAEAKKRYGDWKASENSFASLPDKIRFLSFDSPYDRKRLKEKIYYFGAGDAYQANDLNAVEDKEIPFPLLTADLADDALADKDEKQNVRRVIELDGERGIVLPGIDTFDRWTPFSIVLTLKETQRAKLPAVIAQASFGQLTFNGWDLMADDGCLELRMYRIWPGNMIAVRTRKQVPFDEWFQVTASYDGSSAAKGLRLFVNGEELETVVIRDRVKKRASVGGHHGGKLTIGQRFRDRGMAGWFIDDLRVFGRALSPAEITHFATGDAIEPDEEFFVGVIDEQARESLAKLNEARKKFVMAEEAIHEIPVMEEMGQPRETHVLARGEYNAPTNEETRVARRTLSNIGPEFPKDEPVNRLGLARWATLPDHPLTSRVIVNRLWSNFFGHGLVRTPENFGLQGELPTHPELLDWLARDFVSNHWDIKRLCQHVVLSATYRQDSRAAQKLASMDPENRWLARGPAHRLSSEQIRDVALAASGLINAKRGGPPVSPYQAGGDLWRESNSMSPAYKQSVGQDLYRRSLYSVWKRTAPLPNMLAFDAESREVCIVNRARTNTPLQALVLMNDQQFVEAARALAQNSIAAQTSLADRIELAFKKMTGRTPDNFESKILTQLFESEVKHYKDEPSSADLLINSGESKPAESMDPVELAAMTVVCQAIMNLDATIWKR